LLQGDRKGLPGYRGHLGRDDGAQALAELVEVGVDLPAPHGRQAHQGEFGVNLVEQFLDRRLHHGRMAVGHERRVSVWWGVASRSPAGVQSPAWRPLIIPASWWAARSTSSLTTT